MIREIVVGCYFAIRVRCVCDGLWYFLKFKFGSGVKNESARRYLCTYFTYSSLRYTGLNGSGDDTVGTVDFGTKIGALTLTLELVRVEAEAKDGDDTTVLLGVIQSAHPIEQIPEIWDGAPSLTLNLMAPWTRPTTSTRVSKSYSGAPRGTRAAS